MSFPDTFADLEYALLAGQLRARCHSALGAARADALRPLRDKAEIEASLALCAETQDCARRGIEPELTDLTDLVPLFTQPEYSLFGFEEFRRVHLNALAAISLHGLLPAAEGMPFLKARLERLHPYPELCCRFGEIFDPEGEVLDTASPRLKSIRRRTMALRGNIQKALQSMLSDPRFEHSLQDRFITQRDDRYVLPVKESAAPQVPGIVQSHSGSGATLFIEPQSVVPLNNELQLLKQEEKQEIYRIFSEFTSEIKALRAELEGDQALLAELDFRFACGRYGLAVGAGVPRITAEPLLKLSGARHPLLILNLGDPKRVVPFDLELGMDYRIVILSGPNTGGKTVLMKSVGLLTLSALSGIPIPASEDSEIGMFSSVFADIGDDQSIENALSTFSSHLGKIGRMLGQAGEASLVLIDEIGAATDPQQGSALAQAVLERFTELGCKGVVTTHYTALKIFGESHPACRNAAMQFDLREMHPTYRFSPGIPGDSFAIEVASSLGLDPALIERAKGLSGSQNLEFTELLRKLQDEKKVLARSSYEFQLRTRNLEARLQELDARDKALEAELKERKQKFIRELQRELISQQKLYQQELDTLKTLERDERKSHSERKLHAITDRLRELDNQLVRAGAQDREQAFDPKPGNRVWLSNFEAEALVLEIRDGTATVDMNGISFKVPVGSLFKARGAEERPDDPLPARTSAQKKARFELKLLGCTFDEAQPLIDGFLDDAVLSGLHTLRIVHGKGTGALRSKVRDYLRKKKQVLSLETPLPSEGGSGVTLVKI
jgi:DNA mismatch repair protein MutS2